MRRYLIYYLVEEDQLPISKEIIVKADDMEQAIRFFKEEMIQHKSITTITELCHA